MFSLESDLLAVLERRSRHTLLGPAAAQESTIYTELSIGMIIPDLVIVHRRRSHIPRVEAKRNLSWFDCCVLSELLKVGPLTQPVLGRRLLTRESKTTLSVERLLRLGLLVRRSTGTLKVTLASRSNQIGIIAVEAKLLRWRQAIRQAQSYRSFANESFVALPRNLVSRIKGIGEQCASEGVGLISVSPRSVIIHVRPQRHQPISPDWVWLVSRTAEFQA